MYNVNFTPVNNNLMTQRRQMSFGSNQNELQPKKHSTVAGKVIGGVAAYTVAAPTLEKALLTKVMPYINKAFKPLAEAYKAIPLNPIEAVKMIKTNPEKVAKIGEEMMKLSTKSKVGLYGMLAAATIGCVVAGAKLGGWIQSKFQSN